MMENHNEHIDHLFKSGLGDYSEMPPASVWDDLEKRLDKKKNKKVFFFRWLGLSLLFVSIIAAGISYYATSSKNKTAPEIALSTAKSTNTNTSTKQTKITDNQQTTEKTKTPKRTLYKTDNKAQEENTTETNIPDVATNKPKQPEENNSSINNKTTDNQSVKKEINSKIATLKPKRKYLPFNNYSAALATIPHTIAPTTVDPMPHAPKEPNSKIATLKSKRKYLPISNNSAALATLSSSFAPTAVDPLPQAAAPKEPIHKIAALKPKRKYVGTNNMISVSVPDLFSPTVVDPLPQVNEEVSTPVEAPVLAAAPVIQKDNTNIAPMATYSQKQVAATEAPASSFTAKEVNKVPSSAWEEPVTISPIHAYSTVRPIHTVTPNIWASTIKVENNINNNKIADNQDNTTILNETIKSAAPKVEIPQTPEVPLANASFSTFQIGIKAGYEGGASQKMVISPYLFYNVAPRLSLMIQPGLKLANAPTQKLNGTQSFYKVNSGGSMYEMDSSILLIIGNPNDTFVQRNYNYTQTHDSIVKSYKAGGTYVELEVPILLKYDITPKFSVYGGVNIVYGKTIGVHEDTYNSGPITKTGTSSTFAQISAPIPTPDNISNIIKYSGNPLSSYAGPLYPSSATDMFRMGYMLGCSYEWKKRWLVDATVQQTFAKSNVVGGYDINKPLSSMYIRFTIGYILIK
jgi:hypothetical protein